MANKITRQASNEKEKMFLERFNSLCYTRSSWQVWSDFITAAAIAIANSTEQNPKIHEEREKEFSKTSPLTGNSALFPEEKEEQEFWYTPMWFSDVWNMRRAWNLMDLMFRKMSNEL